MAGLKVDVRIEGLRQTIDAFRRLPPDANNELRDRTMQLAEVLAGRVRAAGTADSPQSARAAASVRARRDRVPVISAGGTRRASAVLFGSEFGANRRYGWYAASRYRDSLARQYRPHRGAASYWFFSTISESEGEIAATWLQIADAIAEKWAR